MGNSCLHSSADEVMFCDFTSAPISAVDLLIFVLLFEGHLVSHANWRCQSEGITEGPSIQRNLVSMPEDDFSGWTPYRNVNGDGAQVS